MRKGHSSVLPSVCCQSDPPSSKSQAGEKKKKMAEGVQLILVWSLGGYGMGGLNCGVKHGKKLVWTSQLYA